MGLKYCFKNKKRAFTLIELMVVIAIIGLLASVVLVSMQGTRERARIAKGLEFSQSVQNALGAYAVGWWSFETIEGGKVIDGSSYGNNGTVIGATIVPGLEQLGGNALSFDGNDYVDMGSAPGLEMGTGAITVEHWINPPSWTGYRSLFFGGATGGAQGYGTALQTGGTNFRYEVYGTTGGRQVYSVNIGLQKNQWNHIVAVFDGVNNVMIAYLNGVAKHRTSIADPGDVQNSSNFIIGSYRGAEWYFNGLIDEVRIYTQALSAMEIQKHYVEGLEKYYVQF